MLHKLTGGEDGGVGAGSRCVGIGDRGGCAIAEVHGGGGPQGEVGLKARVSRTRARFQVTEIRGYTPFGEKQTHPQREAWAFGLR